MTLYFCGDYMICVFLIIIPTKCLVCPKIYRPGIFITGVGNPCGGVRAFARWRVCLSGLCVEKSGYVIIVIMWSSRVLNAWINRTSTMANLDQESLPRMMRWCVRWHYPRDTQFKIIALWDLGWARYFSITDAGDNIDNYQWTMKNIFVSFKPISLVAAWQTRQAVKVDWKVKKSWVRQPLIYMWKPLDSC